MVPKIAHHLSRFLLWVGKKLASEHTTHKRQAYRQDSLGIGGVPSYPHDPDLTYLDDDQWIEQLKKGGH